MEAVLPADADAGAIEGETNRRPLLIAGAVLFMAMFALTFQLFNLQVVHGQRNLELADGNRLRDKVVRAPRGVIYDRTGKELARNQASFDVTITPRQLPREPAGRQALYAKLSPAIGVPPEELAKLAEANCVAKEQASPRKPSPELALQTCLASPLSILVKSSLPREAALALDQESQDLPGVTLDVNPIREYLDNGLLAASLGYTGRVDAEDVKSNPGYGSTDLIGKLGIESQYETQLRGRNGSEQTEVDASGRPIKLLSSLPSQPGDNLVLSIDYELQAKMAEALKKQMDAAGSIKGSAVALNPKTGEVLALVNQPSYDGNLFAKGIGQSEYNSLLKDPGQPLFNKAIAGGYPSGSIIKPFIASGALQERVVSPETTVNDTGQLVVPNKYDPNVTYTFRSYEPGGLGSVNITRALAVSSNVFFFTVGGGFGNIAGLGIDRLAHYYNLFGLGHKTGIDIPGETNGLIPTPAWKDKISKEGWNLGDTYNTSVGQGDVKANPLQMAVALAAVANGGTVYQPHVVKRITDSHGATVQDISPKVVQSNFISPDNLNLVRNALKDVVNAPYGTACCKIKQEVPVVVAGKTGTAETDPDGKRKAHSWFEAYAPADDPQIVIVALIENAGEGAQFSAPAVREMLAYCFTRPGGCLKN